MKTNNVSMNSKDSQPGMSNPQHVDGYRQKDGNKDGFEKQEKEEK